MQKEPSLKAKSPFLQGKIAVSVGVSPVRAGKGRLGETQRGPGEDILGCTKAPKGYCCNSAGGHLGSSGSTSRRL